MNEIDAPHARLHVVSPNEFGVDEKDDGTGLPAWDDPIKLRIGSFLRPSGKFYIGAISLDVLRRQGDRITREEVGLIKLAVDEHVDGDHDPVPMIEVFLCPKVGQSQDADMQRVITISRKGVTFHVPTAVASAAPAPSASVPPLGRVTRFYTDHGEFCFNMQDDGAGLPTVIIYDTHDGSPDEASWTPVGRLPVLPL